MKKGNPWIPICPGIKRQTLTSGKTMYQMLATLEPSSKMPAHQHPQEQIVHVLSGRMKLIVDGMPHEMKAGDSYYLASNVPHGVETIEETRHRRSKPPAQVGACHPLAGAKAGRPCLKKRIAFESLTR